MGIHQKRKQSHATFTLFWLEKRETNQWFNTQN